MMADDYFINLDSISNKQMPPTGSNQLDPFSWELKPKGKDEFGYLGSLDVEAQLLLIDNIGKEMGGFLEDTGQKREREMNALNSGEMFAMEMRGDFFAEKEVQTRRNVPYSEDEDKLNVEEQKNMSPEMIEMQRIKNETQQIFEEAQR